MKVARPYSLKVWVGDKERVLAVQDLLENALEEAYNVAATRIRDGATPGDRSVAFTLDRLVDDYKLKVEVRGKEGRWTREGELSAIFDDVELDDIESIVMSNRAYGPAEAEVSVAFTRSETLALSAGVQVNVAGDDKAWVTSLHDSLVEKLSRGRPRWAFATTGWFAGVLALIAFTAGLFTIGAVTPAGAPDETVSAVFLGWTLASFAFGVGIKWMTARTLPAFEVTQRGSAGQGARTVAVASSVTAFVLSALVIPLVLALTIGG